MTKVTVILTSYNHASYLKESIDSVLSQTFVDFDLIIWDDASEDNSWDIILSYNDPRIQKYRNEKNQRSTINRALTSCFIESAYIAIHHSDDIWEPTKLEKQVAFLESHPEVGAVFTNAHIINEKGDLFADKYHPYYSIFEQSNRSRHEWLNYFFYHGNALCHPSVLIRKECYKNCGLYRYGLAQLADYDMWIRLCLKYEIYIIPEKLVKFRVRDNEANVSGNTSAARIRLENERYFILNNFIDIKTVAELIKVFPHSKKYMSEKDNLFEFILAMTALESNTRRDIKLFGLMILYKIVNDNNMSALAKELYDFDYLKLIGLSSKNDVFLSEMLYKINNPNNYVQLFIDEGDGFSEASSISKYITQKNKDVQKFEFNLSHYKNIRNLRLDPLNDSCVVEIEEIFLVLDNGEQIDLVPHISVYTCYYYEKNYFFESFDPQIYFNDFYIENLSVPITLIAKIKFLQVGNDALQACIRKLKTNSDNLIEQNKYDFEEAKSIIEEIEVELDQTRSELISVYLSKSWRITRLLRKIAGLKEK